MVTGQLDDAQTLFLAGERLDPDTYAWATEHLGIPVVDHWWQTETGWAIAANLRGLETMPLKPGSASVPVPGFDVRVLDGLGDQLPVGEQGSIAIRLPLPPGTLATIWGADDRLVSDYLSTFGGYYLTGDGGYTDDDGYLYVMGRTDDVINVAGHRLSTGEIEAVLASHEAVAECAVIGVLDEIKGQVPRGLVVLREGYPGQVDQLAAELVALVRSEIGAVVALRQVDVVAALPKTRSGKILRRSMRGDRRRAPRSRTVHHRGPGGAGDTAPAAEGMTESILILTHRALRHAAGPACRTHWRVRVRIHLG